MKASGMPERVTGSLGRANIVPDSGRYAGSVNNDGSVEWGILRSWEIPVAMERR